jgi:predicted DNA-binding transcriptional regulator AlpA
MNDPARKPKRYIPGPQVLERYGDRSEMWLWRRLKFDPKFPRPVVIGKRRFFDEDELDAYDHAARMEATT